MKKLIFNIFDLIINLYFFFYLGLFITDYSFIFSKPLSNISGFTALLLVFLAVRWISDKGSFEKLFFLSNLKKMFKLNDISILLIIFCLLFIDFTAVSIVRHISLSTRTWDMGIPVQALWNTLQGDILFSSLKGNMNLLGDHFQPIYFLLAPFYRLCPHVITLLILQSLLLAVSIYPLYFIAKDKLKDRLLIFAFILSFVLYKPLRGIAFSDFHLESFIVPLSFLAFYCLTQKKHTLFWLAVLFLLCTKETAVFITIGIGLYTLFFLKRFTTAIILIILSVFAWIYETKVFIPHFNDFGAFFYTAKMPFGETYQENLLFILQKPAAFIKFLFLPEKIKYCLSLFGPVGFLNLFRPYLYALGIPPLFSILIGNKAGYCDITSHYVAHILPFVYIMAIYGAAKITGLFKKMNLRINPILSLIIIFLSLFFYTKTDAYKLHKFIKSIKINRSFEKFSYLKLIPDNASVSATSNLVPHLSHRKYIYDWDSKGEVVFKTEYIIIDSDFSAPLSKDVKLRLSEYKKFFSNPDNSFLILRNPHPDEKFINNFRANFGL